MLIYITDHEWLVAPKYINLYFLTVRTFFYTTMILILYLTRLLS